MRNKLAAILVTFWMVVVFSAIGVAVYSQKTKYYEASAHTIAIDDGIENGTIRVERDTAHQGDSVVIYIEPAEGYRLKDSTLKYNDNVITDGTTFEMPDENVTIYAVFEKIPYVINYDTGDGASHGNVSTYVDGDNITLQPAVKLGYNFQGWYLDREYTRPVLSTSDLAGNVTLFAKFEIETYTITYHTDELTSHTGPAEYTVEETIELEPATKLGYAFLGWYLQDNYNGEPITTISNRIGDIDLYPRLEILEYDITYHLDADVTHNNPNSYTVNDDISLTPATRVGYTFGGWYSDSGLNHSIATISHRTGSIDLYARWQLNIYTITYHMGSGETHSNPETYNVTSVINLSDASRDGYTFDGWYSDPEFTTQITSIENSIGNIDLYPKYTVIVYNITYHVPNGATHENADTYSIINDISFTSATLTGYSFGGWYLDDQYIQRIYSTNAYLRNLDLYAKFTIITYSIIYHMGENETNSNSNPESYTVENSITLEPATKPGYNFVGWYTDDQYKNIISSISSRTGLLNLYPKFVLGNTITYHIDANTQNNNPLSYATGEVVVFSDATKSGYIFDGWYTESTFDNVITSTAGLDDDLDLYPKFDIITYTITYHMGSGETHSNPNTYDIENPVYFQPASKTGYVFDYWFDGNGIILDTENVLADIDLSPVFHAETYTITYHMDSGETHSNADNTYTDVLPVTFTDAVKLGYTFDGWYTESTFVNSITSTTGYYSNLDLYPKFTLNTYTITYHMGAGVIGIPF